MLNIQNIIIIFIRLFVYILFIASFSLFSLLLRERIKVLLMTRIVTFRALLHNLLNSHIQNSHIIVNRLQSAFYCFHKWIFTHSQLQHRHHHQPCSPFSVFSNPPFKPAAAAAAHSMFHKVNLFSGFSPYCLRQIISWATFLGVDAKCKQIGR